MSYIQSLPGNIVPALMEPKRQSSEPSEQWSGGGTPGTRKYMKDLLPVVSLIDFLELVV